MNIPGIYKKVNNVKGHFSNAEIVTRSYKQYYKFVFIFPAGALTNESEECEKIVFVSTSLQVPVATRPGNITKRDIRYLGDNRYVFNLLVSCNSSGQLLGHEIQLIDVI